MGLESQTRARVWEIVSEKENRIISQNEKYGMKEQDREQKRTQKLKCNSLFIVGLLSLFYPQTTF